jgi:hypothetical protein
VFWQVRGGSRRSSWRALSTARAAASDGRRHKGQGGIASSHMPACRLQADARRLHTPHWLVWQALRSSQTGLYVGMRMGEDKYLFFPVGHFMRA